MIEHPYDGCGKCLLGVRRLSRMKLATSSPERQREDALSAAAYVGAAPGPKSRYSGLTLYQTPDAIQEFAVQNDILAVHRDHFGLWNNGTPLVSLGAVNGRGLGDTRHRDRGKQADGRRVRPARSARAGRPR